MAGRCDLCERAAADLALEPPRHAALCVLCIRRLGAHLAAAATGGELADAWRLAPGVPAAAPTVEFTPDELAVLGAFASSHEDQADADLAAAFLELGLVRDALATAGAAIVLSTRPDVLAAALRVVFDPAIVRPDTLDVLRAHLFPAWRS
jgi:hypothetical protein